MPDQGRYREIDCVAERLNASTINITSEWTTARTITVVEPHHSYHESVLMDHTDTMTLYTSAMLSQQNADIVAARKAFEAGLLKTTSIFPFPSLVFKIVE